MDLYFEVSRHKDLNELNNYLYNFRSTIVEIVKIEEQDEYVKPLLLIVRKAR